MNEEVTPAIWELRKFERSMRFHKNQVVLVSLFQFKKLFVSTQTMGSFLLCEGQLHLTECEHVLTVKLYQC